jgi:hypothetical protein
MTVIPPDAVMIQVRSGHLVPVHPVIYRVEVPMPDGHADRIDRWAFGTDTMMTAYKTTENRRSWDRYFEQQDQQVREMREKTRQSIEDSSTRCEKCIERTTKPDDRTDTGRNPHNSTL